jgi:hypothetical protein
VNHDDTKKGLSSLKESKTKIISLKLAGNGDMIYIKIVKGEITWGNWQHSQMDNTLIQKCYIYVQIANPFLVVSSLVLKR